MNQLLDRAISLKDDLDNGIFDKRTWEDMAVKVVESSQRESDDMFRIADEITVIRRKKLDDARSTAQNEIRQLNNERIEMEKKEKEVRIICIY